MRRPLPAIYVAAVICFAAGFCSGNDSPTSIYQESLEIVWQTVNENHYDSTFGGLDFEAIRNRYRSLVSGVDTDEGFIELANKMLQELKLSHYAVFNKEKASSQSPLFSEGSIGLDVRLLNNEAVVTSVKAGFPAAEAGIRTGYTIVSIDGEPVDRIVADAWAKQLPYFNERRQLGKVNEEVISRFYGEPETSVTLAYLDEHDRRCEKTLSRMKRPNRTEITEELPPFVVEFESAKLKGDIGYISFNTFMPPVDERFSAALDTMMDVRGLIIDIRGNPGGSHVVGEAIASRLLQERTLFSVFRTREGSDEVYVEPEGRTYAGPIVILIDVLNRSASERFSGCMQSIGRATIIGERSSGSVGPSDALKLPNGSTLMYLIAQSLTPDGTVLEGHGVIPDITVALDKKALLDGVDSQLERAVEFIDESYN